MTDIDFTDRWKLPSREQAKESLGSEQRQVQTDITKIIRNRENRGFVNGETFILSRQERSIWFAKVPEIMSTTVRSQWSCSFGGKMSMKYLTHKHFWLVSTTTWWESKSRLFVFVANFGPRGLHMLKVCMRKF
jgi:hypothetical protein